MHDEPEHLGDAEAPDRRATERVRMLDGRDSDAVTILASQHVRAETAASSQQAVVQSQDLLADGRTLLVQSAARLARGTEREKDRAVLEQAVIDLEIRHGAHRQTPRRGFGLAP